MGKWRLRQKCACINFRGWKTIPDIYMIAAMIIVFLGSNISWLVDYSKIIGIRITPWILPHIFSFPIMLLIFGYLTIIFFSRAPFQDAYSQFMEIRVGKKLWIEGQLLYIVEASAVYSCFYLLVTLICIIPRCFFSMEWGNLIKQLAASPGAPFLKGITPSGLAFYQEIVLVYTPLEAMLLSLLLMFLVTIFIGVIIFTLQIVFGHGIGIVVAGFFTFLSYFTNYVGWMMFENKIFYISPINWISLGYLDINHTGQLPDVVYAIAMLILWIILLGSLGVRTYCAKDRGGDI